MEYASSATKGVPLEQREVSPSFSAASPMDASIFRRGVSLGLGGEFEDMGDLSDAIGVRRIGPCRIRSGLRYYGQGLFIYTIGEKAQRHGRDLDSLGTHRGRFIPTGRATHFLP